MAKRKAEGASPPQSPTKKGKPAGSIPTDFKPFFREGLFDEAVEGKYRNEYATAEPFVFPDISPFCFCVSLPEAH